MSYLTHVRVYSVVIVLVLCLIWVSYYAYFSSFDIDSGLNVVIVTTGEAVRQRLWPSSVHNATWIADDACQNTYTDIPSRFTLTKPDRGAGSYVIETEKRVCLREGTRLVERGSCKCRPNWEGPQCSVPSHVLHSWLPASWKPVLLTVPRRLVVALPVNMEFDLLEARFAETGDLVDVFVLLESTYTAYGDRRPLHLLRRLRAGYFGRVQCKVLYVQLDYFKEEGRADGWVSDRLHRDYIGLQGVKEQLAGVGRNDLFVLNDADEIPSRESLLFLKMHAGIPTPIAWNLLHTMYGFYWETDSTSVISVVTMAFLSDVLDYKAYDIRTSGSARLLVSVERVKAVSKETGEKFEFWSIGSQAEPAGWHCSWCLTLEGIRNKLVSAQNGDFPRWGDYPEKLETGYLRELVKHGRWFNADEQTFQPGNVSLAPRFFLENKDRYRYLLECPYT